MQSKYGLIIHAFHLVGFTGFILLSCEPLVTDFKDIEKAILYESSSKTVTQDPLGSLLVMTWNIRFGAARIPWFGDSCGDRVIMTRGEVITHLNDVADYINAVQPDILLLQEVDTESKRGGYMDQVQWLFDHSHFNNGAYASMWQAQFIPSDGLGRVDVGNAILSRWIITDAERIQLPLRTDQDELTQYFYLRRNILKTKIAIPNQNNFYAVCAHTTAFATDDTKQKHIEKFELVLAALNTAGATFIAGGDLNSVPSSADSTDYCMEDKCSGESYHSDADGSTHKEGSYFNNFTEESLLLLPLYSSFSSAVGLELAKNPEHFTHSPWNTESEGANYWDRKLDYIFSSGSLSGGITHQGTHQLSDHAPVSAILELP